MQIVVIGGGIAGLTAAQAARETSEQAEITLICGENRPPYFRTRLNQCVSGQLSEERLAIHQPEWYEQQRIRLLFGRVVAIARESRQVRLMTAAEENLSLPYDRLVIATGGRGFLPNFSGNERDNVLALRSVADLELIDRFPGPAVVLGDGAEAVELAGHLSQAGRHVTLVGRNKRLLHRSCDHEAGVFYLSQLTRAGVRVALNGTVELFDGQRTVLEDGRSFAAGLVIAATGWRSVSNATAFLVEEPGHGVPVDEHMRTNQPDMLACGDCAELNGQRCGRWALAMAQGKVAGINAACADFPARYQPPPLEFRLDGVASSLWAAGQLDTEESESRRDPAEGLFAKLFYSEGLLQGAELIGDVSGAPRIKRAIERHAPAEECAGLWPEALRRH